MTDQLVENSHATTRPPSVLTARGFAIFVIALTLVRLMALRASPLGLHPDEAQYWTWSRSFDWGYFSKPPLVAWTIAATTSLFGNEPWAVRLAAPIAHAGAAFALFALGRRMYGEAAGWWAGASWLLIPGVALSSALMTTDAVLLPLWAAGLFTGWRWVETRVWQWALATGALIGLGALAKYAMLYFPLCAALAAAWSPTVRRAVFSWQGLAALGVATLVLSPNLAWNAAHDFETVAHTAANADWQGDLLNLDQLVAFLGDQFAIAGALAVALIVLLVAFARGKRPLDDRARYLLAFLAPPLVLIIMQALISRAHGNWAATAYPAAMVLIAGAFAGSWVMRWTTGLHLFLCALLMAIALSPTTAYRAPLVGRGIENSVKRMSAWDLTADLVAATARAGAKDGRPYSVILVDHRHLYCELLYNLRDAKDLPPVRMYVLREAAGNQAEAAAPMTADLGAHALVVHMSERYEPFVAGDFARFRTFARGDIKLGPHKTRPLAFSEASGFQPVARTPEFLARVGD